MFTPQYLSCPVVRKARPEDSRAVARVLMNSDSRFFNSVYRDTKLNAELLLEDQYRKHFLGLYVLQEGEEIIGVMKLHLPGREMAKTVSLSALMRRLGILKGIRATLLLSNWDEYKLSPGEAYIEFLEVSNEWKGCGAESIMYEHAQQLALDAGATHISKYICIRDYKQKALLDKFEFTMRKKIHSPIAKLYGETGTWRKYTFTLINGPITIKEYMVEKIDKMRNRWQMRRRESIAALRVSIIMITIPSVGGILAYDRGYPIAATGWAILFVFHIIGGLLTFREYVSGKYVIAIAMISESVNLVYRAISTDVWMDRGWLIPIAFTNIWVLMSVIRSPSQDFASIEEHTLIQYQDLIQKAKYHQ